MSDVKFDESELVARLEQLKNNGRSMTEISGQVAQMLLVAVEDQFDSKGKGKWPGLSPSTIKRHPRRAGGKLLQDTGELVGSLRPRHDQEVAEVVTSNPYAGYHVEGTKHMPARDFTDLDFDQLSAQIGEMLLLELTK
jgi:phage gpG-like protein